METLFDYLHLRRLGINTHQEPVVYMRQDCHVAMSEGFYAHSRVQISTASHQTIATLVLVCSDLLSHQEAGISKRPGICWDARPMVSRPGSVMPGRWIPCPLCAAKFTVSVLPRKPPAPSLLISKPAIIPTFSYPLLSLPALVTALISMKPSPSPGPWSTVVSASTGGRIKVLDKHCVGGLPGNRTTPVVVAIVAANGFADAENLQPRHYLARPAPPTPWK